MDGFFTESCKITVDGPTAAGTTTIDSTALDMANFKGVVYIVRFGSPAANNNIRGQDDDAIGMSTAADLAGTLVNSATNNVHVLDVKRVAKEFLRCRVTRGTSTTIDSIVAIQYNGDRLPITQLATVTFEQWQPLEGTA